jgi:hypothetical protein
MCGKRFFQAARDQALRLWMFDAAGIAYAMKCHAAGVGNVFDFLIPDDFGKIHPVGECTTRRERGRNGLEFDDAGRCILSKSGTWLARAMSRICHEMNSFSA